MLDWAAPRSIGDCSHCETTECRMMQCQTGNWTLPIVIRYGLFCWRMNAGCSGKTEIPRERLTYLSTLEVCSGRGAIQIHAYLTLPSHQFVWTICPKSWQCLCSPVVTTCRCCGVSAAVVRTWSLSTYPGVASSQTTAYDISSQSVPTFSISCAKVASR